MNNQNQPTITDQLHELDDLYYTAPQALYEATLHLAVTQLAEMLPGLTIAYAEIWSEGSARIQHGGMRHVLLPTEYSATPAEGGNE
jgi:hypothetical protein